ncbi:hypothetical protein GCM10011491_27130 [Brucella endophytica]|uniref:Uncharacterized protein n=1 Tax=Brucella endophytica TaxID=1963359 RepID=A0A916WG25_9HYPH|nr:hypothetical protein [Brucella endophytica]GGA97435.1 hypothetical protein GCM10011491_27130 [Brucella endophytica]
MNTIYNEQTKLSANNLDRLSTAVIAVGVLGETFDLTPGRGLMVSVLTVTAWLSLASGLHLIARPVLGRMKP